MSWVAPSEKDADNATLENCLRVAANRFRAVFGHKLQKYSVPVLGLMLLWLAALLNLGNTFGAEALSHQTWTVDGVVREALVYIPPQTRTNAGPLVFAFHGHGGSMNNAARMFSFHTRWPEAMVVYMQGLNTPGRLVDPEGKKPGWQSTAGAQGDRDLKFFDAVLASLKQDYRVDTKRIYASGHSNGGGFTYLLWATRGDVFAAVAPSAAVAFRTLPLLKPKPVLHVAGEKDTLVKFEWQQQTLAGVRKLNQCGEGEPWEGEKDCTIYPSKLGTPVVTLNPGVETALKPIGGILLKSGRGFHFIGRKIISGSKAWEQAMRSLLRHKSLKGHLDKDHIQISLRRGYSTLRVTASPVKPTVPYFYKEI